MKFQILFPGKIRKNMLSAENFTQSAKHLPVTPNMYSMHVEKYEKITVLFDKNKKTPENNILFGALTTFAGTQPVSEV